MAVLLIHGGTFAGSCWSRLVEHLDEPSVAMDLPGRGTRPMPLTEVTLADFERAAIEEVEALGDDVLLVGHSMAGATIPGVVRAVGDRLRGVVFVSCTVPADGQSVIGAVDLSVVEGGAEVQAIAERSVETGTTPSGDTVIDDDVATMLFCNDMDDETTAYTLSLMVPEATGVIGEPVRLDGLAEFGPKRWVRLLDDAVLPPSLQDETIRRIGGLEVVDLDAAHMAMISRPAELAALLSRW